jgi:murein DD-endopeptidase MepM/ murein hydrolase activator NlpD
MRATSDRTDAFNASVRRFWFASALVVTMLIAAAPAAGAVLSASNGNLAAFTGGVTQAGGTLTAVSAADGTDTEAFDASYSGSGGGSGEASGAFNVAWSQGQTAVYGAAFYLPPGFHTATEGEQSLLRWDSAPDQSGQVQQGGVLINYGDDSAYLVSKTIAGSAFSQRVLAGPVPLPTGRWFTLQVRQLLGTGTAAYSELFLDGKLVGSSSQPTFSGTRVTRVSYGIVELDDGADAGPVSFDFDQATAGTGVSIGGGYSNPLGGDSYFTGRTDMGVDFCLVPGEPIRAVGNGVVVGIRRNWFRGQPYLWYRLLDGPAAGKYVYVAEQITGLPPVGTYLAAGQPIAYYKKSGTCIEIGWGSPSWHTLAQATTGYFEGQVTPAGVSFARFLMSVGVQGPFELTAPKPKKPKPKKPRPKRTTPKQPKR